MRPLKKSDFKVGNTVYVLAHRYIGRKLNEPLIIECRVTKVGSKYITVTKHDGSCTYKFMQNGVLGKGVMWLYYDEVCGTSSDMEIFLELQDVKEKLEAEKIYDEIYDFFRDFTFETKWSADQISLKQLRLISKILNPESGQYLATMLTPYLSKYEKR